VISTTVVDLWGRLSNPSEILETLADQGWSSSRPRSRPDTTTVQTPETGQGGAASEEKGRLSNPVLRHLSPGDVNKLVELHTEGSSIDAVARHFGVHRTTVISHLEDHGVPRRGNARKLTDAAVAASAKRYRSGRSLAAVAIQVGVHERTLARELRRAGIPIRPRNGLAASD